MHDQIRERVGKREREREREFYYSNAEKKNYTNYLFTSYFMMVFISNV